MHFKEFEEKFNAGKNQVIYKSFSADMETPVSLFLKLSRADAYSFLLESVTGGETRGRYSVIGMKPDLIWKCEGNRAKINRHARVDEGVYKMVEGEDPLLSLRALIEESRIEMPAKLPSAAAGLFGYLGYDMIRLVEDIPALNPDHVGVPDAILMRPSIVVVLDGVKSQISIVVPIWATQESYAEHQSPEDAYARACAALQSVVDQLHGDNVHVKGCVTALNSTRNNFLSIPEGQSNFGKQGYMDAVEKARDYIRRGDIFQVVIAQCWREKFEFSPFAFYRSLRQINPSPFLFFFNFGEFQIVGASPEILVRLRDKEVTIRPIAGTRPRGKTPDEDRAFEEELLKDEKECAEHLMLLDLGRNDVGRVSKIGSVRPTDEFFIERYSHVMHIVSNVIGELKEGEDALSALLAGLPAGTLSGAPKIRAMEIIEELEPEKRSIYSGGCGYFAANGDMDMCIVLRTGVIKDKTLYIQAGSGIVYDSVPKAEYQESVNKSAVLREAARDAWRFEIDD